MTRQQEIKEGIASWFLERNPDKTRSWAEWETKMLFIKQDSQGVVLQVEKELPNRYFTAYEGTDAQGYILARDDMLKWHKETIIPLVEPLIKEE